MSKKIKAWYFCQDREAHGDKRPIEVGITHSFEGTPVLCASGQHASIKPLDALHYGHGHICYQVELSGEMDIGDDKISAQRRTYLKRIDCTDLLPAFARWCALQVAHLVEGDNTDLIVRYLEAGDKSIRAAAAAVAWDAVFAAAAGAERSAWAAALDAAGDAALDAALDAGDVAWDARAAAAAARVTLPSCCSSRWDT